MGLIYAIRGQAQQALDMFTAATVADPLYVEAINNLGVIQKDIGLTQQVDHTALFSFLFVFLQSLQSYERCLKISPSCRNPDDNFLLGVNYIECGSSSLVSDLHLKWGDAISASMPQMPPIDLSTRNLASDKILKVMLPQLREKRTTLFLGWIHFPGSLCAFSFLLC